MVTSARGRLDQRVELRFLAGEVSFCCVAISKIFVIFLRLSYSLLGLDLRYLESRLILVLLGLSHDAGIQHLARSYVAAFSGELMLSKIFRLLQIWHSWLDVLGLNLRLLRMVVFEWVAIKLGAAERRRLR